jgi:putative polyketide hydroxylase
MLGQDADGVTVRLRDRASGDVRTVRADYVVAADGHRGRTRDALGIGMHGRGVLSTAMSIVFEADLTRELRGRGVVLYHMRGSLPGGSGSQPTRWNIGSVTTAPMEHRGGSATRAAGTGEEAGAAEVAEALAGG